MVLERRPGTVHSHTFRCMAELFLKVTRQVTSSHVLIPLTVPHVVAALETDNIHVSHLVENFQRLIAQTLENLRASKGEKLVAWQLPPDLPLANDSNRNNAAVAGRNNNTNRRGAERTTSGAGNAANRSNKSKKHKKLLEVADLRAGQLGEIEVYADGTAKLVIGECRFDLDNGAEYRHHEQFVIIDEKKKKCAFVGDIVGRVVATPDVDQLIEQSLKEESDSDDDDDNDDGDSDVDITNADND